MSILTTPTRLSRLIFWYWLLTGLVFLVHQLIAGAGVGATLPELFAQPRLVLAFLITCLSLILAVMIKQLTEPNFIPQLKIFVPVIFAQQLMVANLLGALALALLWWHRNQWPKSSRRMPTVLFSGGLALIMLCSLVIGFAQWRLLFS